MIVKILWSTVVLFALATCKASDGDEVKLSADNEPATEQVQVSLSVQQPDLRMLYNITDLNEGTVGSVNLVEGKKLNVRIATNYTDSNSNPVIQDVVFTRTSPTTATYSGMLKVPSGGNGSYKIGAVLMGEVNGNTYAKDNTTLGDKAKYAVDLVSSTAFTPLSSSQVSINVPYIANWTTTSLVSNSANGGEKVLQPTTLHFEPHGTLLRVRLINSTASKKTLRWIQFAQARFSERATINFEESVIKPKAHKPVASTYTFPSQTALNQGATSGWYYIWLMPQEATEIANPSTPTVAYLFDGNRHYRTFATTQGLSDKTSTRATFTISDAAEEAKTTVTIDASNTVIDGQGHFFNDGKITELLIQSKKIGTTSWAQTQNVTIKNCIIRGGIRIIGMGRNGEAADVKASSISLGHTERAQAAAPTKITLSNVIIETHQGMTLLYAAPGTTYLTVENSVFQGENTGSGPIVYLDAESGYNVFRNNTFNAKSTREVVACDGSAYNLFEGNAFNIITQGGIYLYRNCGEKGTVRHQTPHHNTIRNNTFNLQNLVLEQFWGYLIIPKKNYGVWLGSRNGGKNYCGADAGYNFGSSIDDRDFADNNVVTNNVFQNNAQRWYVNDTGTNNQVSN